MVGHSAKERLEVEASSYSSPLQALSQKLLEWGYLAYVYAKSGRQAEAEKLMAEAPILHPDRRGPHQLALVFAGFGDREHTIERLEQLALSVLRSGRRSQTELSRSWTFRRLSART